MIGAKIFLTSSVVFSLALMTNAACQGDKRFPEQWQRGSIGLCAISVLGMGAGLIAWIWGA